MHLFYVPFGKWRLGFISLTILRFQKSWTGWVGPCCEQPLSCPILHCPFLHCPSHPPGPRLCLADFWLAQANSSRKRDQLLWFPWSLIHEHDGALGQFSAEADFQLSGFPRNLCFLFTEIWFMQVKGESWSNISEMFITLIKTTNSRHLSKNRQSMGYNTS